jgi:hypothetical protein
MKLGIIAILFLQAFAVRAQEYPFAKDFIPGTIILKDSTKKSGQIKWYPDPGEKLKFRENENAKTIKYTPDELLGFNTDSLKFISLYNFDVYAAQFALLGKKMNVKQSFCQLLDSGRYSIYLVFVYEYNALSGVNQKYPNLLFERKTDSGFYFASYPVGIRMSDKKYEKAKDDLYIFFKDYPDVIEKIKRFRQQDNFFEIVDLVKNLH